MLRLCALFLLISLSAPAQADILDDLRPGHPRLILLDDGLPRLRSLIKDDADARRIYTQLKAEAERIDAEPTVKYEIVGPRLLAQSRLALKRIYTLALLYRLEGERRWLDRAVKEMRAAAAFKDWNPSHFLDTAELTHAFAIGYDWLYPALSPADRTWIREAIVEKGLEPALGFYDNRRSWVNVTHNWNQVCNGGILLGALAVAEDEPSRFIQVVRGALESLPLAMNSYAPDGGWNEGPGYWHYATRYNVYALAGMETALGTDYELSGMQGFSEAGRFRVDFSSPTGRTFNYADASDAVGTAEEMFWLARRFNQPVYAGQQLELLRKSENPQALDLVWFPERNRTPQEAGWPLDSYYSGVNVAFLRGSWTAPDTAWAAVKGGDNKANHSHLDLGTFVFDAAGLRWALDFGPDDYNLPAYFGPKRWTYYRLRTESHNVVMIDNENQDTSAKAPVVAREFTPARAEVKIDLTAAYPGKLNRHQRTVTLVERRRLEIRDEIVAKQPVEALWGMVTEAEIQLDGASATLRRNGKTLRARILSPERAVFEIVSTQPPQPQRQNEGTRKLVVRLPGKVTNADIRVTLELAGT